MSNEARERACEQAYWKDYTAHFKNDPRIENHPSENRRIYEMGFDGGYDIARAALQPPIQGEGDALDKLKGTEGAEI